jgi:phosphoribosylformylglycinamidine (FGAM) synthase-like enzyme
MTVGRTFGCHHPRKRMIQYAAASRLIADASEILGRPVKPGDDGFMLGRVS